MLLNANKGCLFWCVSSHRTLYHGGWEIRELFPHRNHYTWNISLPKRGSTSQLYASDTWCLWESSWTWCTSSSTWVTPFCACAQAHRSPAAAQRVLWFPLHGTFLLPHPAKQLVLRRADYLPQVLPTVPGFTQLSKARKCHYSSPCSSSIPNFEANTLLKINDYPQAAEQFTYTDRLPSLPGALEDIHSAVERKSLLAWHQDWVLDKRQEVTAFWPRLPAQTCIWHMPWELGVHAEQRVFLALNISSESARHCKLHRAEFFDLGGMKSWVSLAGIQSTQESIYSKPVGHTQNRKRRASRIGFFFLYFPNPFPHEAKLFWRHFKNKKLSLQLVLPRPYQTT